MDYSLYDLDSFLCDHTSRLLSGKAPKNSHLENRAENCLLVDFGAFKTLGGWNTRASPLVGVYSMVGKNKEEKEMDLSVEQFDILKGNYKQLMERDYINCMSVLEMITDHVLAELVGDNPIQSPVMISECMA